MLGNKNLKEPINGFWMFSITLNVWWIFKQEISIVSTFFPSTDKRQEFTTYASDNRNQCRIQSYLGFIGQLIKILLLIQLIEAPLSTKYLFLFMNINNNCVYCQRSNYTGIFNIRLLISTWISLNSTISRLIFMKICFGVFFSKSNSLTNLLFAYHCWVFP